MTADGQDDTATLERRAMILGMVGSLIMGGYGIYAGYLAQSHAIQLDGLFSLIGFTSAFLGLRVSANLGRAPDKIRPYGYAADEAIFVTFRALTLFGLVLFAIVSAATNILAYVNGATPAELVYGPMYSYFAVVGVICLGLWANHTRSWVRTGRTSGILKLEAKAAAFDGLVTGAAAIGLFGARLFSDGFLAPIAPVADSVIVVVICLTVVAQYFKDFLVGLAELAGSTARPDLIKQIRRAIRPVVATEGGVVRDLSVSKIGRSHTVIPYFDPGRAVDAAEMDDLTARLSLVLGDVIEGVEIAILVTQRDRAGTA